VVTSFTPQVNSRLDSGPTCMRVGFYKQQTARPLIG